MSKEQLRQTGLQFLQQLHGEREEVERDLRIKLATIKSRLNQEPKSSYTILELLDIFSTMENEVNDQLTRALSIISIKGVQRLRQVIEYGLDSSILYEEPKSVPKVDKEVKTKPSEPVTPKPMSEETVEEVEAPIEEKPKVEVDREEMVPELESALSEMGLSISDSEEESSTKFISELLRLIETLELDRSRLVRAVEKLTERETEEAIALKKQIETIEFKMDQLSQYITSTDISSPGSVLDEEELNAITLQAKGVEEAIKQIVAPLELLDDIEPQTDDVLGEAEEEKIADKLKVILSTMKTSLMENGYKAIDKLTETLSEVAEKQKKPSPELEKTIDMFKEELRKRNIILEHTRKLLASNPKFNALFILQELGGGLQLGTLAKSVGIAPVVLKAQLQDFVARNLIKISDDPDPIIEIMFY